VEKFINEPEFERAIKTIIKFYKENNFKALETEVNIGDTREIYELKFRRIDNILLDQIQEALQK